MAAARFGDEGNGRDQGPPHARRGRPDSGEHGSIPVWSHSADDDAQPPDGD
jgi:hypothetical protein